MEQFETATCRPKHILHIKIGVGTAGGAVSNVRAVASEGPLFKKKIFRLIFTNLYRLHIPFSIFNFIIFS